HYNILEDGIEVIFTKSQFKLWKYYKSWDEYKAKFIEHSCQAAKCNEEEDIIDTSKLSYQMLQTLTDISDDELLKLCAKTDGNIKKISNDRETMLRVLGATSSNQNKNYIQQALEIYPELLADTHNKEILRAVRKSMIKNAKAGKLEIEAKYTFICPDLYAFC